MATAKVEKKQEEEEEEGDDNEGVFRWQKNEKNSKKNGSLMTKEYGSETKEANASLSSSSSLSSFFLLFFPKNQPFEIIFSLRRIKI